MTYWAAVQTVARREDAVGERVKDMGYDIMTPRARMRVDGKLQIRSLFPGYLFVEIEMRDYQWYEIRWAIGVVRLVMSGDKPARLPDWEIDKINQATGRNGLVRLPKNKPMPPKTTISVGAEVKIITGNFRGLHALYQGSSPKECEQVLLELFGRKTLTELAPDDRIEPVAEADCKILQFPQN